jgi:hypothetical protein
MRRSGEIAFRLGVQLISKLFGEFFDLLEFEDYLFRQHAFADALDVRGNRPSGGRQGESIFLQAHGVDLPGKSWYLAVCDAQFVGAIHGR